MDMFKFAPEKAEELALRIASFLNGEAQQVMHDAHAIVKQAGEGPVVEGMKNNFNDFQNEYNNNFYAQAKICIENIMGGKEAAERIMKASAAKAVKSQDYGTATVMNYDAAKNL